jgi:hypothetical protein
MDRARRDNDGREQVSPLGLKEHEVRFVDRRAQFRVQIMHNQHSDLGKGGLASCCWLMEGVG